MRGVEDSKRFMVGLLMPFVAGLWPNAESRKIRIADFVPAALLLHWLRLDCIVGRRDEALKTQATSQANRCAKAPGGATKSSAVRRRNGSQLPCLDGLAVKKLAFELKTLAVTAVGVSKTFCNARQQMAYSPRQEVART
jgi:hypothetical protein